MKVDFMIIGAMKAGTTSLAEILKGHRDIVFCDQKEPQFFSTTPNWRAELTDYHALFRTEPGKIYGEGSTTYTYYPDLNLEIWKDIFEYNPAMKFIYLVRNPVDRAVSQYMHMYLRGKIHCSLEEAIRTVPLIINNGRYFTQIKPFIDQFGKENVLILDFEDFLHDKAAVLKEVAGFLELDFNRYGDYDDVHSNKSVGKPREDQRTIDRVNKLAPFFQFVPKGLRNRVRRKLTRNYRKTFKEKPTLTPELKRVILNLTRLDILQLEKLTNRDFSKWFEGIDRKEPAKI